MKKCIIGLTIFILSFMVGCQGGNKQTGESHIAQKDSFQVKESHFEYLLDDRDTLSPRYSSHISLHYLCSDDAQRMERVNHSITLAAFGYEGLSPEEALDSFYRMITIEYSELRPDYLNEKESNQPLSLWFDHSFELKTSVEKGLHGIWNYRIENYYYGGGAHPSLLYTYLNFDSLTGKEILLEDLFRERYEDVLDNLLTDALATKLGVNSRKEIQEKGYLTFNDIFPSKNFLLTPDSIIFLYNQYDIAPYSMGQIELGFTYKELSELLKSPYLP